MEDPVGVVIRRLADEFFAFEFLLLLDDFAVDGRIQ